MICMAHKSVTGKAQVTVRITDQFAKDLNLILACSKADSTTAAVQDAVHQLAEYYRHIMQRNAEQRAALQKGDVHVGD